jgi:hypothetical protein
MAEDSTPEAEPSGLFAKLGAALPVGLAALATAFAGMSSSEMARAMFWRSAAAQDQAKATSQWTLAGFKKDRALIVQTTAVSFRILPQHTPAAEYGSPTDPASAAAVKWLRGEGPPTVSLPPVTDEGIQSVLAGMKERLPERELIRRAVGIPFPVLDDAIRDAERSVAALDDEWGQVFRAADALASKSPTPAAAQAERYDLEGRRYQIEATLNQGISQLYEVRVRRTTAESDRQRKRSDNFFYAMLVAQLGATGGSLALARRRRSALWLLAGLTGLVSVAFGGYVYLTL